MTDPSYRSDRAPARIVDIRYLDAFLVITHQDGPDEFTVAVHPLGQKPAYFGLGDTAEAARLHAWQWIVSVQRRVQERRQAA